jgi:hypothetical protein
VAAYKTGRAREESSHVVIRLHGIERVDLEGQKLAP